MITPRTSGRFAFPGIGEFIEGAGAELGLTRPDDALAFDGARRSSHLAHVATNISGAASTHPGADVAAILTLGESHLRALRLELRAAELAYAAAYRAAGVDTPPWLGAAPDAAPAAAGADEPDPPAAAAPRKADARKK